MGAQSNPDTDELVRQVRAGDAAAVEQLLARHRDRLLRMVDLRLDSRLRARLDPSDVVQDVLLEAARRLPDYAKDPPLPFYPWLRQIAFDRLVDLHHRHVRAGKRSVDREEAGLLLSEDSALRLARAFVDPGPGPSQRLLREELRRRVRATLARLDTQDREILILRHLEQMRVAEIAALLDISEGAVKMRRLRAIQRLRELVESSEPET